MSRRHDVHVTKVTGGSRWKVSQGGSNLSKHNTQRNAIKMGRSAARRSAAELVIHGRMDASDLSIATAGIHIRRVTESTETCQSF